MRRKDDQTDGGERLAGLSPAVSGPPGPTVVIPFPRRPDPPSALLAETSPPEVSAPFIPLSVPVAAVVLRLRGKFPRVQVLRASDREE